MAGTRYLALLAGLMATALARLPAIAQDTVAQNDKAAAASKTAEDKAKQEAAANAAAQAAAQGAGNPPAPVTTQPDTDDSDEAFAKRILAKAPSQIFRS